MLQRRTLLSLPLAGVALPGCTRSRRQDEVFAWYLRPTLFEALKAPTGEGPSRRPIRLVVASQVSVASTFFSSADLPAQIKSVSAVHPSAVADLLLHKEATTQVQLPGSLLPSAMAVDYVSPQAQRAIFNDGLGLGKAWDRFYKIYPGSGGLLTFSPVGFSVDGSQAVFAFAIGCGGLCGSGHVILMRRDGSGWVTQDEQQLWVS
jgi:hypothetical protein